MAKKCGMNKRGQEVKEDNGSMSRQIKNQRKIKENLYNLYDIEIITNKNGTRVIELRKITGDRRDWRRWIETVPMQ